jgi:hypothetical protein
VHAENLSYAKTRVEGNQANGGRGNGEAKPDAASAALTEEALVLRKEN